MAVAVAKKVLAANARSLTKNHADAAQRDSNAQQVGDRYDSQALLKYHSHEPVPALRVDQQTGLSLYELQTMPVWAALTPQQKAQLGALLSGNEELEKRTRWGLENLASDPTYLAATPAQQVAPMFAALSTTPILTGNVALELGDLERPSLPFELQRPVLIKDFQFRTKVADADLFAFKLGEQTINIVRPHDQEYSLPQQHSVREVAQALSMLPEQSRKLIRLVKLSPDASPDAPKSYMSSGIDGVLDIYPTDTRVTCLTASLAHEAGHVWSMQSWGENEKAPLWNQWRAAIDADGLPVSDYGTESVHEDVAEATALFLLTRGTLRFEVYRRLFPHRFAILERQFGSAENSDPVIEIAKFSSA